MAILETRGLIKFYRGRKVVDGVSFEVDLGEVVGLLGPNGAGKTTSFRMITGQVTPNDGTVLFNGKDVAQLPMYRRARLGLGYLPQQTSVFRKLTVEQNILAILEVLPVYRSLGRKLTRAERYQKTDEVLEQFGLDHLRKNNASRLSGGETRRLEIARCLVCDPLIILLDEPFAGIDPQTVDDIQQIIRDLKRQGIGILVTDHQVQAILAVTDRIYVIHERQGADARHAAGDRPQPDGHQGIPRLELRQRQRRRWAAASVGPPHGPRRRGEPPPPPTPPAPVAPPTRWTVAGRGEPGGHPPDRRAGEDPPPHRTAEDQRPGGRRGRAAAARRSAVPHLLEALERRDVDLRLAAFEVLQRLVGDGADFDPHAPEAHRRRQLAVLREHCARKAG